MARRQQACVCVRIGSGRGCPPRRHLPLCIGWGLGCPSVACVTHVGKPVCLKGSGPRMPIGSLCSCAVGDASASTGERVCLVTAFFQDSQPRVFPKYVQARFLSKVAMVLAATLEIVAICTSCALPNLFLDQSSKIQRCTRSA